MPVKKVRFESSIDWERENQKRCGKEYRRCHHLRHVWVPTALPDADCQVLLSNLRRETNKELLRGLCINDELWLPMFRLFVKSIPPTTVDEQSWGEMTFDKCWDRLHQINIPPWEDLPKTLRKRLQVIATLCELDEKAVVVLLKPVGATSPVRSDASSSITMSQLQGKQHATKEVMEEATSVAFRAARDAALEAKMTFPEFESAVTDLFKGDITHHIAATEQKENWSTETSESSGDEICVEMVRAATNGLATWMNHQNTLDTESDVRFIAKEILSSDLREC